MSSADAARGRVFVAPKRGATQQGPLILDDAGEPIWFHPLSGNDQAFDFRAQTYRGKPVLTWWQGRMQLYRGGGVGRILDARYRPVATVRAGNGYAMDAHEMKLTPDGTALTMSYYVVPWDLSKLGGRSDGLVEDNVVQEIDVETGAVLWEWHTLGSIPLGESYRPAPKEQGKIHDPWHLNSVELDADGRLHRLRPSQQRALQGRPRDRRGRVAARRQGERLRDGPRHRVQAAARRAACTPTGRSRCSTTSPRTCKARDEQSRGIVLEVDEDAKTASLVREFEHPDELLSTTQGSMQVLDGGGAFVGWGGLNPEFTEFAGTARSCSTRASWRRASRRTAPTGCRGGRVARGGRAAVATASGGGVGRAGELERVDAGGAVAGEALRRHRAADGVRDGRPGAGLGASSVVVEALGARGRVLGAVGGRAGPLRTAALRGWVRSGRRDPRAAGGTIVV